MQDTFAYRPKLHFTAPKNWLNDPNGLVCAGGYYHLFYQHHPFGTQWGPMHWGHAVSRDLYHWEHRDIALYPDEKGMIFSGSAVIDEKNVSGLGDGKTPPMLLFFTYDTGETEYQSMAYSLDEGKTFQKYGKILIENPGIRDFRDPKVIRVGDDWVMGKNRGVRSLAGKRSTRRRRVGMPRFVRAADSGRAYALGTNH